MQDDGPAPLIPQCGPKSGKGFKILSIIALTLAVFAAIYIGIGKEVPPWSLAIGFACSSIVLWWMGSVLEILISLRK